MELISEQVKYDLQNQIIYRGEGNSSIVIALKNGAKVIRLWKKDGKIMKDNNNHNSAQHPMRSISFIHMIMKPLTEPFLRSSTELVHLQSDLINLFSKQVNAERPLHRLDKTLHLDDQYAIVMDDLCVIPQALVDKLPQEIYLCGPTISVEIKPKQGFLPIQRSVMKSVSNDQVANQLKKSCLYGSIQHLKLVRGKINDISEYCPVNLFSGCPIRMRNALYGLIKNPQNNFRIFQDLFLAYDEANQTKLPDIFKDFFQHQDEIGWQIENYKEDFMDLLIESLLKEPTEAGQKRYEECYDDTRDKYFSDDENIQTNHISNETCLRHEATCRRCDKNHMTKKPKIDTSLSDKEHELPPSCVLASVLKAQRLDTIGPQQAREMLDWLLEHSSTPNVIEELSKPQLPKCFGLSCCSPEENKEQYYFRKVWEYLVSLTAKDCSIIITLRRIAPSRYSDMIRAQPNLKDNLLVHQKTGTQYLLNVGIADLDQKMPSKVHRICEHISHTVQQMISDSIMNKTKDSSIIQEGRKYMLPQ